MSKVSILTLVVFFIVSGIASADVVGSGESTASSAGMQKTKSFEQLDADDNDTVTLNELQQNMDRNISQSEFDQLDENRDGKLSQDEWQSGKDMIQKRSGQEWQSDQQKMDKERSGAAYSGMEDEAGMQKDFDTLDADNNDTITLYELRQGIDKDISQSEFDELDENRDGKLSQDEWQGSQDIITERYGRDWQSGDQDLEQQRSDEMMKDEETKSYDQ